MAYKPTYDALTERVAALEKELHDIQQKFQHTKNKLVAVQESEHLYRSVVDHAEDAISLMDVESKQRIHVNKIAQKMTGRSTDEIRGINLYQFVKTKEKGISKARLERLLNGETLEPQEYTLLSHDGRKILVEAKSFLIELKNRKIAVNVHRDISHRKKAEAKLKESERRYRLIIDKAEDAIFLADVKTVKIVDANKAAQNMLGKTLDEIKEKTIFDIVSPADRDILEKRIQRLRKENTIEPQEYSFLIKGKRIFVEAKPSIFELNGRKTVISIQRDITDRKNTEERLKESETRYRSLIETLNDGFSISDKNNRITYVNEKFCNMVGYPSNEIVGKPVRFLISGKKNKQILKHQIEQRRKGIANPYEIELTGKDGNPIPTLTSPQSITDAKGNFQGAFGIITDLSELKKAEKTIRKSEEARNALLNATTESALLIDLEGTIIAINQVGATRFGRSVDEITGMTMKQYLPADVVGERKKLLKAVYRSGKPFRFQDKREGRIHDNSLYPIYDENEEIVSFAIFAQDITRRKLAMEGLQESISHFTSLLENSDEYILISDNEGKPIVWNKAYAQIMKDILGIEMEPGLQPHKRLTDKEAIAWWDNIHKRALGGEKFREEYTIDSPSEGLRYLELSYNPIVVNGEVNGFSEITRDITELKQAIMRAEESEETARALLNAPSSYSALLDRNGIILDANEAMAKRFHKNVSDFIGLHSWDLLPPQPAENRKRKFDHVIRSKKMIYFEDERKGTWFNNIFFPILNAQNEVIKVGCLAYDITDRKKIEDQLKAFVEEKEVLIREIHHRVKNNMQIIMSLLQLQTLQSNDKKVNEMFDKARNRISTMALVHEKLYQSDKLSTINLDSYIQELAINLFDSFNVNANKVSIKREIADTRLSIDRAIPIGLILNELISNSLKYAFSDDRAGELLIKLCTTVGNEIELIVRDNGIGITNKTEAMNGKTLGLKLVKTLVEKQLKGKIDIEHDQGTQYRIRFLNT